MKAGFLLVGSLVIAASLWVSGVFTTPASTLLIMGATAKPTLEGHVAAVFDIENQGAPDELLSVSSTMATATIAQAGDSLPVRTGTSSLAMDAAYVRIDPSEIAFEDGTLVPLTLTFAQAGPVSIKARYVASDTDGSGLHMAMQHSPMSHNAPDELVPSMALSVVPKGAGWVAQITTENFAFSEALQNAPHRPGTGHGHIFLGGMKLGRLYGETYDIGRLPAGRHIFRVTLNTNDHRAYTVDGAPLSAQAVIVVD